jgi:hypothetical protein
MTWLASIGRVLEKEYMYKVDNSISGSCVYLGVPVKVGVLDDTLEMSIDNERLKFCVRNALSSKRDNRTFRCVTSIKVTPKSRALASDNRFWIDTARTASVRCGLILGKHFAKLAAQMVISTSGK